MLREAEIHSNYKKTIDCNCTSLQLQIWCNMGARDSLKLVHCIHQLIGHVLLFTTLSIPKTDKVQT